MKWDMIVKAKEKGGLGLGKLKEETWLFREMVMAFFIGAEESLAFHHS